jgi:hypothetical protein
MHAARSVILKRTITADHPQLLFLFFSLDDETAIHATTTAALDMLRIASRAGPFVSRMVHTGRNSRRNHLTRTTAKIRSLSTFAIIMAVEPTF